jgi:hypothetical protein
VVTASLLTGAGVVEGLQTENKQLVEPQKTVSDKIPVPPGFADYLRKIGTPESAIRDIQRQTLENSKPESTIRNVERRVLAEQRRKLKAIGNPLQCLDVSASKVLGSSVPSYVETGLPGLVERLDYKLNVKNKCLQPADNVVYNVEQTTTCPAAVPPTVMKPYTYEADPFLVPPGQNSGMLGPKYTLAGCKVYDNNIPVAMELPSAVSVVVQAMGEIDVDGTIQFVTSSKNPIPVT